MASITIVTEAGEESFPLQAATVVLGRGLESDVRLKDIKASRRHCQIVKTPQGFEIMDLSSGNGTYVNGQLVNQASEGTLTGGRLLFQSEGAEVYFRRIELQPLP